MLNAAPNAESRSERAPVTLLDCTLRDGGYYNDWDFPRPLIKRYVNAMAATGIPIVEIGFRTADTTTFLGPAAYATDAYLESLDLPQSVTYGVMMNAKELVEHDDGARLVTAMFSPAAASPVDLVRIAAHFQELDRLPPSIDRLHSLGYRVGLNLMQIASRSPSEIEQFGHLAERLGIEVAYFADSFGGMQPADVSTVVQALSASFPGPIGCHMHNNMSLGFANAMAAVEAGATWVDSTVLGMGRGPGNAQTEYLAVELSRRGLADLDVVPLLPIVTGDFAELHRAYGWGASVYYFLSAAHNIHPTYIQEMTKDGRYSVDEIVTAVEDLKSADGASFSRARLEAAAIDSGLIDPDGTWDATGWCEGRDVLIVGPGPEGLARRDDIESYIRTAEPVVIALNAIPPVDPSLVDLFAICHPVRAMIDADTIKGITRPVVMPRGIQSRIGSEQTSVEFRDYGISADGTGMTIDRSSCASPRISAFPYALAIATAGGAKAIQLSGFDGFESGDPRQEEMESVLRAFSEHEGAPPLTALTPTNYPIARRSIYAPITSNS
jgi:4-hydroxy 2-oxovalerate aldolase